MKCITLLLALCVFAPSLTFADVSGVVEDGKTVGVVSTDTEGNVRWTVRHLAAEGIHELSGPLNLNGTWVYAIGGDVLTLSDEGQIVARTQYPAMIGGLRVEDNRLWVTLKSQEGRFAEVLHLASPTNRGVWSSFPRVALRTISDLPVEVRGDEVSDQDWERAVPKLISIEEMDLTNPISSAYLGLAYAKLGQDSRVVPAFERAIARSTTWSDDLRVCGILERAQKSELAEKACAQAVTRMKDTGLRPEAMWGMVVVATTTQDLAIAMSEAIEARDYKRIDRIAGFYRAAYPNGEASTYAWEALSVWLAAEGQHDLAKRWQANAQAVRDNPFNDLFHGETRSVDLALLFVMSSGFALLIGAFAIGIGSQRRRPGGEGWRRFLCPPTVFEALSMLAMLLLTSWAMLEASRGVSQIGHVAQMPMVVLSGSAGSPDEIAWLETFEDSEAKAELLTYAKHHLEAFKSGQEVTLERPPSTRITDLIRERSNGDVRFSPTAIFALVNYAGYGTNRAGVSSSEFVNIAFFPGLLIFMIVGRLASQVVRRRVLIGICAFIPGALSGVFAPWIAMSVIAGILYMATPLGTILQNLATPAFTKYYGLEAISSLHVEKPDLTLILVLLIVGMSVHISTVFFYARAKKEHGGVGT